MEKTTVLHYVVASAKKKGEELDDAGEIAVHKNIQ